MKAKASGNALFFTLMLSSIIALSLLTMQSQVIFFQKQVSAWIHSKQMRVIAERALAGGKLAEQSYTPGELLKNPAVPWQRYRDGPFAVQRYKQIAAFPIVNGNKWQVLQTVVRIGFPNLPPQITMQRQQWRLLKKGVLVATKKPMLSELS